MWQLLHGFASAKNASQIFLILHLPSSKSEGHTGINVALHIHVSGEKKNDQCMDCFDHSSTRSELNVNNMIMFMS